MRTLQFIGLTPEEFKNDLLKSIEEAFSSNEEQKKPEEKLELLNTKEVAKILRISEQTVKRWADTGKLLSYGIGNRVYYKRHEIEGCLIDLTPRNND